MTTATEAFAALRTRLATGFTALPIRHPNDDREIDSQTCPNGFVYVEPRVDRSEQIGVNGASGVPWRDYGTLAVLVYVPRNTKIGTAEAHAEAIRALFGVNSVSGVYVTRKNLGVGQGVESTLGKFYCVPLQIEWFADRTE